MNRLLSAMATMPAASAVLATHQVLRMFQIKKAL